MTETLPRFSRMAHEDLKCELYELKKRLHDVSSENYLYKVKIRKLQSEVDKKNRQIECLLDPRKSTNVRKIISERGATMIINLKQRNGDLEAALLAKDVHIRKLQSVIDTSKVYASPEKAPGAEKYGRHSNKLRSRSLSVTPVPPYGYLKANNSDVQLEYARLAQNLQKIKLAHSGGGSCSHTDASTPPDKRGAMPASAKSFLSETDSGDSERNELEEYLAGMIAEMEHMKRTVTELSREQTSMKQVLQDKNNNIELLAKRVRHLQRRKRKKHATKCRSPTKQDSPGVEQAASTDTYTHNSFEDSGASRNVSVTDDSNSSANTTRQAAHSADANVDDDDDDDVETGD